MRSYNLIKLMALVLNCTFLVLACSQAPKVISEEPVINNGDTSITLLDPMLPNDSGDLVSLKASVNNSLYQPAGDARYRYLYVEVNTKEYQAPNSERKPLNVSLVIDRSGSMKADKLAYVKKAAAFVVQNLSKSDFISIVSYSSDVDVTWPAAELQDKKTLEARIETLLAGGGTNLSGGMLEGFQQVKAFKNPNYTNRVLLLTDGLANEGISDSASLCKIAKVNNLEGNITLSTFGVGVDYNENLLQQMAELGSGNYYFIASPEEIPEIFKEELDGLLSVIAQNSELRIQLPEGVSIEHVFGYEHQQEGNEVTVAFKDLVADEEKGVLLKIKIEENTNTDLVFNTQLSYTDAVTDFEEHKLLVNTAMEPNTDVEAIRASRNDLVEQWVTFYESNHKLQLAIQAAENNNPTAARTYLFENSTYMESRSAVHGNSENLQKMMDANTSYDQSITSGTYSNSAFKKGFKKEVYDLKTRKK